MPNKILIANVFGAVNRGDAALLEVCVDEIKRAFPEAILSGIAYAPEIQKLHMPRLLWYERIGNCSAKNIISRRICNVTRQMVVALYVISGQSRLLGRFLPRQQREAIGAISDADIVISCPGGYLEDSNPSYYANLMQLWIAKCFRKPLILAPQSIGPIRSKVGRSAAKHILSKADLICVREPSSEQFLLNTLGISSRNILRTGDLAFWHFDSVDPNPTGILRELGLTPRQYIAVSVIKWNFPTSTNPSAAADQYVKKIAKLLAEIHSVSKLPIVIVNQVSADIAVAQKIQDLCSDFCLFDRRERTVPEIRTLIGNAEIFLGSRFHSCIFALLANVPTVALSYLPKTSGIMKELSLEKYCLDIEGFDEVKASALLIENMNQRSVVSAEIKNAVDFYRNSYPEFEKLLREFSYKV